VVVIIAALPVAFGLAPRRSIMKQLSRAFAMAVLLALSFVVPAAAQSGDEPAASEAEAERLRYKDPAITLDPSEAARADRLRFNNPGSIQFRLNRDEDARRQDFLFQIPGIEPW
jgi:hypothetical protein